MGTVRKKKGVEVAVEDCRREAQDVPGKTLSPDGDPAENAELASRVCRKLLLRVERIVDRFPDGAVTETKCQREDVTQLFKLRDLTSAYKDLAGGIRLSQTDVEDLSPVMAMVDGDSDEDEDGEA